MKWSAVLLTRIDRLTPAQEANLIAYRERWLSVGRSCEPADRPRVEAAFVAMYNALGKDKPYVWWCDGPAVGSLVRHYLGANLRTNLGANLDWMFWGQHESHWPAFYLWPHIALREMHTAEQLERLKWWVAIAESCGWWQPYEGVVFACERPLRQAVDARGRLHMEGAAALLCRDGWPVYAWHGVTVPEAVIMHPITLTQIQAEQNIEIRRVMIERFGAARYIEESEAKVVHQDDWGTLYRAERTGDTPLVMVKVVNSTPEPDGSFKDYYLRVPPSIALAHEAVAWTFGFDKAQDYAPIKQT